MSQLKKLLIKIAVAVALLIAFILSRPQKTTEDTENPQAALITLREDSSLSRIDIVSKNDHLNFVKNQAWQLENETAPLDPYLLSNLVRLFSKILASEKLSATEENFKAFGFDSPSFTVTLYNKQGIPYVLTFGKALLNGDGYYFMIPDNPFYYVMPKALTEHFTQGRSFFYNRDINPVSFMDIKQVSITNQYGSMEIIQRQSPDSFFTKEFAHPYAGYSVDDYQFNNQLIKLWNERFPFVMNNLNPHPSSLSYYGLDKPQAAVSFTDKQGRELHLLIGRVYEDDISYFAKLTNSPAVFTMDSTVAESILHLKAFDLLSKFVALETLSSVKEVLLQFKEINLAAKAGNDESVPFLVNNKSVDSETFKNFYEALISLFYETPINTSLPVGPQEMSVTYLFNDGRQKHVVFSFYNEKYTFVTIDGRASPFLVGRYQLQKLMSMAEQF